MAGSPVTKDPVVAHLRDQITQLDRSIVRALNMRLRLVATLKRYKESRGVDFLDPTREDEMLQDLLHINAGGPLSSEGVRELFEKILDLTKREVGRAKEGS